MVHEALQRLAELALRHPGKTVGAVCGLVFGLLVIFFGVLRAFFLVACIIGGLYVGARVDSSDEEGLISLRSAWRGRWGR